ncbi:hypothetical protein V495_04523 [Pseudogymnoascus sp. VKM F-4514 (FW-929)]|nr:hypothetical protein V495_04523 [Pseudogymnoascus sp. VKM F-4514 (FW-929)]KFY57596.1 hypothetical protein V497_05440 [Pseudogymnoascus sp. VKM F-4516 (FW-969)]
MVVDCKPFAPRFSQNSTYTGNVRILGGDHPTLIRVRAWTKCGATSSQKPPHFWNSGKDDDPYALGAHHFIAAIITKHLIFSLCGKLELPNFHLSEGMARIGCGKSGGCRTCRRRKVKCDERRPTCDRCQQSKRDCEGYAAEHRFVSENARAERYAQKKQLPQTAQPKSQSPQDLVILSSSKPCPGPNLGLQGFEDNIYVSFLLSNLFLGIPASSPWPGVDTDNNAASCATTCVRALATMYFGRVHHQKYTTTRGQELYGKALVSLNHELQDPQSGMSLSTVTSAMILEIYELVSFNSMSGWLKHAGGVGRLIELRGPWRHQSPMGRNILEANRVIIIINCLIKRKRCFLSSTDWKTVPWAQEPESKTSISYLHDILSDVPGLMENADTIQFSDIASEVSLSCRDLVLHQLASLWTTLYEWRVSWQLQNPASSWEAPSTTDQNPFPTAFHFSSLIHANAITLYNATLLLLFKIGFQVLGPSFNPLYYSLHLPHGIDYGPHIPPTLTLNTRAIAIEICKSVEYHFQEERRGGGTLFLLFPLRLAWQTFEQSSVEAAWIQGVMEMIADSTAIEISRGLTSHRLT